MKPFYIYVYIYMYIHLHTDMFIGAYLCLACHICVGCVGVCVSLYAWGVCVCVCLYMRGVCVSLVDVCHVCVCV